MPIILCSFFTIWTKTVLYSRLHVHSKGNFLLLTLWVVSSCAPLSTKTCFKFFIKLPFWRIFLKKSMLEKVKILKRTQISSFKYPMSIPCLNLIKSDAGCEICEVGRTSIKKLNKIKAALSSSVNFHIFKCVNECFVMEKT